VSNCKFLRCHSSHAFLDVWIGGAPFAMPQSRSSQGGLLWRMARVLPDGIASLFNGGHNISFWALAKDQMSIAAWERWLLCSGEENDAEFTHPESDSELQPGCCALRPL